MFTPFWSRREDAGLDFNGEEHENYGFSDFFFLTNLSHFDVPYAHFPSLLAPVLKHPECHVLSPSFRSNPVRLVEQCQQVRFAWLPRPSDRLQNW
jgi:hypothetical protein